MKAESLVWSQFTSQSNNLQSNKQFFWVPEFSTLFGRIIYGFCQRHLLFTFGISHDKVIGRAQLNVSPQLPSIHFRLTIILTSFSGPHLPEFLLPFRKPKRIRTAFSPSQLLKLEQAFEKNQYVVGQERKELAKSLNLSETQVRMISTFSIIMYLVLISLWVYHHHQQLNYC